MTPDDLTPEALIRDLRIAADRYTAAILALGETRIARAACDTALKTARAEILLGLADVETEENYGRNADLRAARMDADLLLLVDALRFAEVDYINAATGEHAARVAADLVQSQIQLLGMLLRR